MCFYLYILFLYPFFKFTKMKTILSWKSLSWQQDTLGLVLRSILERSRRVTLEQLGKIIKEFVMQNPHKCIKSSVLSPSRAWGLLLFFRSERPNLPLFKYWVKSLKCTSLSPNNPLKSVYPPFSLFLTVCCRGGSASSVSNLILFIYEFKHIFEHVQNACFFILFGY